MLHLGPLVLLVDLHPGPLGHLVRMLASQPGIQAHSLVMGRLGSTVKPQELPANMDKPQGSMAKHQVRQGSTAKRQEPLVLLLGL